MESHGVCLGSRLQQKGCDCILGLSDFKGKGRGLSFQGQFGAHCDVVLWVTRGMSYGKCKLQIAWPANF